MSWKSRQLGGTRVVTLLSTAGANPLTLTGTPATSSMSSPSGTTVGVIQGFKLSEWISTGEVWRPLGVNVMATTTITVTAPVFTLQKAPNLLTEVPVSAATGGAATGVLQVAPGSFYAAFTGGTATSTNVAPYTFAAADAAGDAWNIKVSTSPTAGAAVVSLHYALIDVAGISDAVTTL